MSKELNHHVVIDSIQRKIELKRELRAAKKNKDDKLVNEITSKISKIENKLSSSPIQKI